MPYFKKLIGEKCYLSPWDISDAEKCCKWLNDTETMVYLESFKVFSVEKEREFLENSVKKDNEKIFAVVDIKTNEPVGGCGLHGINYVNRNAEMGIFIGEKENWGKGYGEDAVNLILDFGFNVLNLNMVWLGVHNFNKRGIRCYEKCGFKHAGKFREAYFFGGEYHDTIIMDILASEFKSRYIKGVIDKVKS
jgi:RimJ/RimL family protein N-acetyltransferase